MAMVLIAGSAIPAGNERATFITTHAADFKPGGQLDIEDSFGELHVTGWDESRIEVVVNRKTQKEYDAAGIARAEELLKRVVVDVEELGPNHFVIATHFPDRNLLTRPLRGKSNLDLTYEVRIPRNTAVNVKHDIGEVVIDDISGDVKATCRIGEIHINLPADVAFDIDAKARVGNVDSAVPHQARRAFDTVAQSERKLYARVGIGDITIRPGDQSIEDELEPLEVEVI
jgi:hypothetical protein